MINTAIALLAVLVQDPVVLWSDLQQTRPLSQIEPAGPRGRGGQVEEWYTPRVKAALSFYGRASFPSDTEVTIDGLYYSDFFDAGLGLGAELDILTFVTPHWGVGGYVSATWDRFGGNTLRFSSGDEARPEDMDLSTVIIGGKVMQRAGPFVTWEGRIGLGVVHYSSVNWSGIDAGAPFSDEQLFKSTSRVAFEIGARIGFGNPTIEGDFGFGVRIMGGAQRGRDVTSFVDPDVLTTFMLELGITLRF